MYGAHGFSWGDPIIATLWAYFGSNYKMFWRFLFFKKQICFGGWFNVENSVKPTSYRKDLQKEKDNPAGDEKLLTTHIVCSNWKMKDVPSTGGIAEPLGARFASQGGRMVIICSLLLDGMQA